MGQDIRESFIEHCDLKAEVLGAEYVDDGLLIDQITIKPVGTFRRTFGRDILRAELDENEDLHEAALDIEVSREGLYDMLPEGLFHQPDPERKATSIREVVEAIRRTRKEEENTRKFFLAIEKEFYRSRIQIELNERRAFTGAPKDIGQGIFQDFYEKDLYLRIWKELEDIEPEYRPSLLQVLPRIFSVIGNVELTTHIFQRVLNEHTELRTELNEWSETGAAYESALGDCFLGYDSFAGSWCLSDSPRVSIVVGPLTSHKLNDFLPGGKGAKTIDFLTDILFPAETEFSIFPLLVSEQDQLTLDARPETGVLGYSSCI